MHKKLIHFGAFIVVALVAGCASTPPVDQSGLAEQGKEHITKDQITKELINSWWDSPKVYGGGRTQCEEVENVFKVHPSVGEKAFFVICSVNRSHAEGFTTSLIIRPKYKEAREFINIGDGVVDGRDIDKVVDIDHDGISEIVIGTGSKGQGFYGGDRMVVSVKDWLPHILFKRQVNDCSGSGWFRYVQDNDCSFGSPVSVSFKFEDLDGDEVLDLVETVTHYEGFEEVSIEEAVRLEDCWFDVWTNFKSCWRKIKPGTPVRDDFDIHLTVGKAVNRYLFKNGNFVPFYGH